MRKTALALVCLSGVVWPGISAYAQSAEETILYMLHGMEGKDIYIRELEGKSLSLRPMSDGRTGTEYIALTPNGVITIGELEYEVVDGCHTKLKVSQIPNEDITKKIEPVFEAVLDWSKVSSITLTSIPGAANNLRKVKVSGLNVSECKSAEKKNCIQIDDKVSGYFFGEPTEERSAKALAYFKESFCKGSAF